jgi:hypothetical protein
MDETETFVYLPSSNGFIPEYFSGIKLMDLIRYGCASKQEAEKQIDNSNSVANGWIGSYNDEDYENGGYLDDPIPNGWYNKNTKEGISELSYIELAEEYNKAKPKVVEFELGFYKSTDLNI